VFVSILSNKKIISASQKLMNDILALPNAPGIYYFLNKKNDIIYIGKAKSLSSRVKNYFSPTAPYKAKKIVKQAAKIKTEVTNSELTALLKEAETIKLVNPKHNSQLKRYGNKYFIRIDKGHKFPKAEISNKFDFDGNDYFGLFISRKRAEVVLNIIDKTFALRECTDKEFARGKKCFLADIERCTAPCIKKKDNEYFDELNRVYEFLFGKNQSALDRMLNKMKDFSQREKYEKAAETKEIIDLILSQIHKSSLIAEPVNSANVLFEITEGLTKDHILMLEGKFFVRESNHKKENCFETALDDFYEDIRQVNKIPTEEDLEKMKITLNWMIKNRNKVRVFYLKDYITKGELYSAVSNGAGRSKKYSSDFNLKYLSNNISVNKEIIPEEN